MLDLGNALPEMKCLPQTRAFLDGTKPSALIHISRRLWSVGIQKNKKLKFIGSLSLPLHPKAQHRLRILVTLSIIAS